MKKPIFHLSGFTVLYILVITGVGCTAIPSSVQGGQIVNTSEGGVIRTGTVSGCVEGNGTIKTDVRTVDHFSEIHIDGSLDVSVDFQETPRIVVEIDENILPHVTTEVKGQTLHISSQGAICTQNPLVVQVSTDQLSRLISDGANRVTVSQIDNKELTVGLNGSGELNASGQTGKFVVTIGGASSLFTGNLRADEVQVRLDGAGEAEVHATKKLVAEITGAGDIRYSGNPADVTKTITGVGVIEPR